MPIPLFPHFQYNSPPLIKPLESKATCLFRYQMLKPLESKATHLF